MQKYLPIADVAIEVNWFAFMLMEDSTITGVHFQNGPLKGFNNVKTTVSIMPTFSSVYQIKRFQRQSPMPLGIGSCQDRKTIRYYIIEQFHM